MKEIGGYMSLEDFRGREYHSKALALNTAANCLRYLIRAKKIKKVYIPLFLCSSVKRACEKEECNYEYYHIDNNFMPIFDKDLNRDEYIYIVNFYGQLSYDRLQILKNKYKNMIADNVQAFYDMPLTGVDTLYSCRKFFGVPDGAYLYTDKQVQNDLETDISYLRMDHVGGRYEETAQEHYHHYSENEQFLDKSPIKLMSRLTHNLLRGIDYDFAGKRRTENFQYLHRVLHSKNKLDMNVPEGAFMYPFYTDNGADLKKKLIANKIFVPTLWPNVFDAAEKGMTEYDLAENIVPLPIDQRYDVEDMRYIVDVIKEKC